MTWVRAGRTGVDSGSILLTDPCYVVRDRGEVNPYTPYQSYEQLLNAVDSTFDQMSTYGTPLDDDQLGPQAAQITNQFGADIGVYITRFGGDGIYPVYVELDARGQVIATQIRFDGVTP